MKPERGRARRDDDDENTDGLERPARLLPPMLKMDGADEREW